MSKDNKLKMPELNLGGNQRQGLPKQSSNPLQTQHKHSILLLLLLLSPPHPPPCHNPRPFHTPKPQKASPLVSAHAPPPPPSWSPSWTTSKSPTTPPSPSSASSPFTTSSSTAPLSSKTSSPCTPAGGGRNYLNLSNFKDDSTPVAWELCAWVRWYTQYIENLFLTSRLLGFFVGSNSCIVEKDKEEERVSALLNANLV
ncbi:unnamed protein product [Prunus armeniaca]|uniref:Uncharacterized protein n=1 Tax=Prunus armeniaca TaxID=36596 RepID=A0A6J5VPP7_PRUAR|nr:unnamed protein product [Prunus armeniaca]CAB4320036.1 unnamed protein product [Prunus armeniaca]